MEIRLDHITVPTKDRANSARLLGEILGVPWAASAIGGPFSPVYVNSHLTIDFDEADGPFPVQHYAFLVGEPDFTAILDRIVAAGLRYRSSPHGRVDMKINADHGGRIAYWDGPGGHIWEILTVSYARNPKRPTAQ